MYKSLLDLATVDSIKQIAKMKGITEYEAIAEILNTTTGRYADTVRVHWSADRAMGKYNDKPTGYIKHFFIP